MSNDIQGDCLRDIVFHYELSNIIKFVWIFIFRTVDGWNPAPVEVGSLSHYLQRFTHFWRCKISSIFHMPPFFVEPTKSIRSTLKNHLKRMDWWLSTPLPNMEVEWICAIHRSTWSLLGGDQNASKTTTKTTRILHGRMSKLGWIPMVDGSMVNGFQWLG